MRRIFVALMIALAVIAPVAMAPSASAADAPSVPVTAKFFNILNFNVNQQQQVCGNVIFCSPGQGGVAGGFGFGLGLGGLFGGGGCFFFCPPGGGTSAPPPPAPTAPPSGGQVQPPPAVPSSCNDHNIPANTSETVPAGCVVVGDIEVGGTALYTDDFPNTGTVSRIDGTTTVFARFGASVTSANLDNAVNAEFSHGCAGPPGCTAVDTYACNGTCTFLGRRTA